MAFQHGRPRAQFKGSTREQIYDLLCKTAIEQQSLRGPYLFWRTVVAADPTLNWMSWPAFRHYYEALQADGLIELDPDTGAMRLKHVRLVAVGDSEATAHE